MWCKMKGEGFSSYSLPSWAALIASNSSTLTFCSFAGGSLCAVVGKTGNLSLTLPPSPLLPDFLAKLYRFATWFSSCNLATCCHSEQTLYHLCNLRVLPSSVPGTGLSSFCLRRVDDSSYSQITCASGASCDLQTSHMQLAVNSKYLH